MERMNGLVELGFLVFVVWKGFLGVDGGTGRLWELGVFVFRGVWRVFF